MNFIKATVGQVIRTLEGAWTYTFLAYTYNEGWQAYAAPHTFEWQAEAKSEMLRHVSSINAKAEEPAKRQECALLCNISEQDKIEILALTLWPNGRDPARREKVTQGVWRKLFNIKEDEEVNLAVGQYLSKAHAVIFNF